jgi:hypothetical protein
MRIVLKLLRPESTVSALQAGHLRDLFLDFIHPLVRGEVEAPPEEATLESLDSTYRRWAESELLRYAYVALYHLWEKDIVSFMQGQIRRAGDAEWNPGKAALETYVRDRLRGFGVDVSGEVMAELRAGRMFANAAKHGGRAVERLRASFPRFFSAGSPTDDLDLWAWAIVSKESVDGFHEAVMDFWERIELEAEMVVEPDGDDRSQ